MLLEEDNLILATELTIQIATVKSFQADVSSVSTSSERRTSHTLLPCAITGQLLIAMNWL